MSEPFPPQDTLSRFQSRLRQFIRSVGDDLNLRANKPAEPVVTRATARATTPTSTDNATEKTQPIVVEPQAPPTPAVDPRLAEESLLSQWRETLADLREARQRRKHEHAARIERSHGYIGKTLASVRALQEPAAEPFAQDAQPEQPPASPAPLPKPFAPQDLASYIAPALDLLRAPASEQTPLIDDAALLSQQNKLQETLDNFAVDAFVCEALVGPRVTQYRVRPGFGVKVGAIANLDKNIALALAVNAVRIQAPIPGEPYVGIEVPNLKSAPIALRSAFESNAWRDCSMDLPLVMGMDITGSIVMCDLAKAPHMLIAGATGSGKSVSINNILLSLLYRFRPDELELVLVDPKKVEFAMYKDIPHLIHPVVDDPKQACQALKWLVREMEARYTLLSEHKVRNLAGYNAKAKELNFAPLPYMVLIIDELADLMMTARQDVETPIARLAQMSRAVGIHTVLATQRPSVNVITGVIKANYPTRVAFQVSSQIDSRTILDAKGAESLQGRGDMLYNPPGLARLMRLQSPFVDDPEIVRIAEHLRAQAAPRYRVQLPQESEGQTDEDGESAFEGNDPLLKEALSIVVTSGKASTSYLQRRLKVGYNRAASLIEELEVRGYIGPQVGTNPREIFAEPHEL